ncbi:MAG: hypothetical protein GEU95_14145 [Rhizobiales bacterium]|nr:hypothetical protein [Hyphomicrobiales bacterium]
MKMVKSLLLGSAAGVVAVVGAQAADLPVKAAPVQYVKICTLYGDGFYYVPGSDTCVRFTGYVRADYGYGVTGARRPQYARDEGANDRTVDRYSTRHRGRFAIDTRTQTAYGTLRTYQTFQMQHEDTPGPGSDDEFGITRAFIQWGGFTFGRTVSFTDHEGSMGDSGFRSLHQSQVDSTTGASGVNQIAYTWQLGNGITFNVGADERRVRDVVNLSDPGTLDDLQIGFEPGSHRAGDNHPNPWVSLRVNQAWGRASLAVIANHNQATYYDGATLGCAQPGTTLCGYPGDKWGFGVLSGAEFKLDWLSPGSRIGGYFNYGVGATRYQMGQLQSPGLYGSGNEIAFGFITDAAYVDGSGLEQTTAWSAGGGFEYFWTRNFSSTVYGQIGEVSYNNSVINGGWFCAGAGFEVSPTAVCDPGFTYWAVGTHHDWFPLPGLRFAVDVLYAQVGTAMNGEVITVNTPSGARPAGDYNVKDLGTLSVVFRAQRTWGAN